MLLPILATILALFLKMVLVTTQKLTSETKMVIIILPLLLKTVWITTLMLKFMKIQTQMQLVFHKVVLETRLMFMSRKILTQTQ